MSDKIEPRVLKGFRDSLPAAEIERRRFIETVEAVFRASGFVPIDTPALEYTEILLGKGGGETEKQVYRFQDNGGRDVALRFDLTVPFARFMAEHAGELSLPFKRYHIAKVWRGENTQRGRYREFYQCDFDSVGADTAASDFEILLTMRDALSSLDIGGFEIHLSHRGVFNRFLALLGVKEKSVEVLRLVDKLSKIGQDEVRAQLSELVGTEAAGKIVEFITASGSFAEVLSTLERLSGGQSEESKRLADLRSLMEATGTADTFVLDPSITRGLDYYTGVVFETFLAAMPEIGSVCSGGRYDDLASLYSKERMPGVGASIGMDRLLSALEALGKAGSRSSYASAIVLPMDETCAAYAFSVARSLRSAGLSCEVFSDRKKTAQQYAYAERKGMRWALVLGSSERENGTVSLRDLTSRETRAGLSVEAALSAMKAEAK